MAKQDGSANPVPSPNEDGRDPAKLLAERYAERRAKAGRTPATKDPRDVLAELSAAQRASTAQEPVAKDPRQRLSEVTTRQRANRSRGPDKTADQAAAPPDGPGEAPPAAVPNTGHSDVRSVPAEADLQPPRADLARRRQRASAIERQLAEQAAHIKAQRTVMSAPDTTPVESTPATDGSAPTLLSRLRAQKRALGELPLDTPPPEPLIPPPDRPPPREEESLSELPDSASSSPPEHRPSEGPDGDEAPSRRLWLIALPILAVLALGLLAFMQLRPHPVSAVQAARTSAEATTRVLPTVTPEAITTATIAVQTSAVSAALSAPPATLIVIVPPPAVATAQSVVIAVPTAAVSPIPSTATAVPAAIPSPTPSIATTVPTAIPSPVPTVAPVTALLSRVAGADAALRTGRFTVTIDDSGGTHATATLVFDLGSGTQPPRLQDTTTYVSPAGTQTGEQITIGDQAWQRLANGHWTASTPQGVWDNVNPYLPHAATVEKATMAGNGSQLTWYDAGRDVDVTLTVDPASGVPHTMQEAPRGGGPHRTITYTAWNTAVDISPPPHP